MGAPTFDPWDEVGAAEIFADVAAVLIVVEELNVCRIERQELATGKGRRV